MEDITYWLEQLTKPNSAEKIMLILTIISITVSSIALIFAIRIPVSISKRQDKIALFEKRYKAFETVNKLYAKTYELVEDADLYTDVKSIHLDLLEELKKEYIGFNFIKIKFLFGDELFLSCQCLDESIKNIIEVGKTPKSRSRNTQERLYSKITEISKITTFNSAKSDILEFDINELHQKFEKYLTP